LGAPEVGEQLPKGQGSHQLVQPGLRERVGVVVVRLLLGPIEYAKGVGTMVLDGPVEGRPTPSQLLLTENAFDENGPVIQERLPRSVLHGVLSPVPVQMNHHARANSRPPPAREGSAAPTNGHPVTGGGVESPFHLRPRRVSP